MTMLANKTALVTGASRGMGRATALALGAAGARVIVHYGRNADEAKAVVDHIRANGGQADMVAADLAAPDGAHVLAAQVRNLVRGKLDILVSNAGISNATTIETLSVKEFDSLFAVNVRAPYFLVQQLLPIMVKAAPSCSSRRSVRAPRLERSPPMPAPRAPSTRW